MIRIFLGLWVSIVLGSASLAEEPLPHLRLDLPTTLEDLEARFASARGHITPERDAAKTALAAAKATIQSAMHPRSDSWFNDPDNIAPLREKCGSGDQTACTELAHSYLDENLTQIDEPLAYALSHIACDAGDAAGCALFVGREWSFELTEYEPHFPDMAPLYATCADGNAEHCLVLGRLLSGYLSYRDQKQLLSEEKGKAFLDLACEMGLEQACKFAKIRTDKPLSADERFANLTDRCAKDDGWGCHQLGRAYLNGEAGTKDPAKALELMDRACTIGYGCELVASYFERGREFEQDLATAHGYYVRACENGVHRSCQLAANALYSGHGIAQDHELSRKYSAKACALKPCALDKPFDEVMAILQGPDTLEHFHSEHRGEAKETIAACASGSADACTDLGAKLVQGSSAHAGPVLAQACQLGSAQACLDTGWRDYGAIGWSFFERACDMGLLQACTTYLERNHMLPADERLSEITELCAEGEGKSCNILGHLSTGSAYAGIVGSNDPVLLQGYYERSCDLGYLDGCTSLARLLDPDVTKPGDHPRMMAVLNSACEKGGASACERLSYEYNYSEFTAHDLDRAYHFSRLSCLLSNGVTSCPEAERLRLRVERRDLRAELGGFKAALVARPEDFVPRYQAPARRLRAACSDGDPEPCLDLAALYENHLAGVHESSDDNTARGIYRHLCEADQHPRACYRFGASHESRGHESRHDLSLAYYDRACNLGHSEACASAGFLYELGDEATGGEDDEETASKYDMRACAFGNARGCDHLSSLFDVSDETKSAFDLIACLAGDGLACSFIAEDYRKGRNGAPQDPQLAKQLYAYGCAFENEDSCFHHNRLGGN